MKNIFKKIIIQILTFEARLVLRKYKPHIVAITGNVGKTSTKDAVYTVLSKVYFARKSEKSFNSEIGIPLTILGINNAWNNPFLWIKNIFEGLALILFKNHYPKWLILEVGADRPGDIEKVTKWLKPDIAVITRIGDVPVHLEFFDSQSQLVKEKSYLAEAVKSDGILILSDDEQYVLPMKEKSKARTLVYGFSDRALVRATNEHIIYDAKGAPESVNFKVDYGSSSLPVNILGTAGFQHIYSILAALAVGVSEDINMVSATEWVSDHQTPPGRMKIIKGIKDTTILDDSYNSSPLALNAALDSLSKIEAPGRKIAVLGDMMELGHHSTEEHKKVGERVAEVCDLLFTVGQRAKLIADGAHSKKMKKRDIFVFEDAVKAGKKLQNIIEEGDVILIKGSQAVRMERTVEEIMAHPEKKHKLLVRQEKEWLSRQ